MSNQELERKDAMRKEAVSRAFSALAKYKEELSSGPGSFTDPLGQVIADRKCAAMKGALVRQTIASAEQTLTSEVVERSQGITRYM